MATAEHRSEQHDAKLDQPDDERTEREEVTTEPAGHVGVLPARARRGAQAAAYARRMTRVLFVGGHGALAAALHGGAFAGVVPHEAVIEAIEDLDLPFPPRVEAAAPGDVVVDTGAWNLPDPAGLCLEEVRELRAAIEQRVSSLPL